MLEEFEQEELDDVFYCLLWATEIGRVITANLLDNMIPKLVYFGYIMSKRPMAGYFLTDKGKKALSVYYLIG